MLDRIDKAIIRVLIRNKDRFLTTNDIAKKVKISNLTARRHLGKLEFKGYVHSETSGKVREYHVTKKENS